MAWRELTETDLTTAMSPDEIAVLRRALGSDSDTVIGVVLTIFAQDIRGAVRTSGAAVDTTANTVPESLIRRVLPCIVQYLSIRAGGVLPDPKGLRAEAAKAGETFLREQVAAGKWAIETPTSSESGSSSNQPASPRVTAKTLQNQRSDQDGI
jgi:hypothetical protein